MHICLGKLGSQVSGLHTCSSAQNTWFRLLLTLPGLPHYSRRPSRGRFLSLRLSGLHCQLLQNRHYILIPRKAAALTTFSHPAATLLGQVCSDPESAKGLPACTPFLYRLTPSLPFHAGNSGERTQTFPDLSC